MNIYKRTSSDDPDFQNLVSLLDIDLASRDGDEHLFYAQFNKIDNIRHAIVWYLDRKPIGCGAFKELSVHQVEIKRMFIVPEFRGKGYAFNILKQLELWAIELNYSQCVLETGKKQPEAIKLYTRAGYMIIKNYGQYENIENSVCKAKSLPGPGRSGLGLPQS
ncbi:MAG: GNAT family N-acetyltransferase [Ferruginibacter sp.]